MDLAPNVVDLLVWLYEADVRSDDIVNRMYVVSSRSGVATYAEGHDLSRQEADALLRKLVNERLVDINGDDADGWPVVSLNFLGKDVVEHPENYGDDGPLSEQELQSQSIEFASAATVANIVEIRDDLKWLKRAVAALLTDRNLNVPKDDEPGSGG
jgi:hypothetical protein